VGKAEKENKEDKAKKGVKQGTKAVHLSDSTHSPQDRITFTDNGRKQKNPEKPKGEVESTPKGGWPCSSKNGRQGEARTNSGKRGRGRPSHGRDVEKPVQGYKAGGTHTRKQKPRAKRSTRANALRDRGSGPKEKVTAG